MRLRWRKRNADRGSDTQVVDDMTVRHDDGRTASMQQHKAYNGEQEFVFVGDLIGFGTTRTDDKIRWTEISVYRTRGGKYIIEKVGVSDVFHALDSSCKRQNWAKEEFDPAEGLRPCPRCNPKTYGQVYVEADRHSTHVTDTPKGAVQSVYNRDKDGVEFMTIVGHQALIEAAKNDKAIRQEYLVQEIE